MRAYSLNELFRLTRDELFGLHAEIVATIHLLSEVERAIALDNLRKLRRLLARSCLNPE